MAHSVVENEQTTMYHWFSSWSKRQKEYFLKDLINKAVPADVTTLFDAMQSFNVDDKPPSIFTCQLRLFTSWFEEWNQLERDKFIRHLGEIDRNFIEQFQNGIQSRLEENME
ncbi:uncharacterized protein C14orf119-like [Anneissia japonica]|uniref:uncharacterized protein C14orf119-like n=1 Tax=Anneissia japonica TaxID=1529436 RepID=UPI0014255685|nr:uncharacterized protein C14orf119-like [Anneissia japonica]